MQGATQVAIAAFGIQLPRLLDCSGIQMHHGIQMRAGIVKQGDALQQALHFGFARGLPGRQLLQ